MTDTAEATEASGSVHVDVVSDVVCPWCYIGKRRLEEAIALVPDISVDIAWRPYFLNPWIPREGIDRQTYLETKFGSAERYAVIAERVAAAPRQWKALPTPSTKSAGSQTRSIATGLFCGRAVPPIRAA